MARISIEALQICKGQAKDSGELFLSNICENCGTYGQKTGVRQTLLFKRLQNNVFVSGPFHGVNIFSFTRSKSKSNQN